MNAPYDDVIRGIVERGYHNHRKAEHSDILCRGIWADLLSKCEEIREDHDNGEIGWWLNRPAPDLQRRKADLLACCFGINGRAWSDHHSTQSATTRPCNHSVASRHLGQGRFG